MTHIKCNVTNCTHNTNSVCTAGTVIISGTSCHTYQFDAVKMSEGSGTMRVMLNKEKKVED